MNNATVWIPPQDFIIPLMCIPWWLPVNLLWNAIVIVSTLATQRLLRELAVRRLLGYLVLTTIVGAIVDTVWHLATTYAVRASTPDYLTYPKLMPGACLRAMPVIIVVLGLVNFLLAAGLLRLKWRRAAILGGAMGLFTAPWLVVLL